jgi:hypothetical protein
VTKIRQNERARKENIAMECIYSILFSFIYRLTILEIRFHKKNLRMVLRNIFIAINVQYRYGIEIIRAAQDRFAINRHGDDA